MKYIKLYESYDFDDFFNQFKEELNSKINNRMIDDIYDMASDDIDNKLNLYIYIIDSEGKNISTIVFYSNPHRKNCLYHRDRILDIYRKSRFDECFPKFQNRLPLSYSIAFVPERLGDITYRDNTMKVTKELVERINKAYPDEECEIQIFK